MFFIQNKLNQKSTVKKLESLPKAENKIIINAISCKVLSHFCYHSTGLGIYCGMFIILNIFLTAHTFAYLGTLTFPPYLVYLTRYFFLPWKANKLLLTP